MKISMVIPCYSLTKELAEMAVVNALTYRSQVDELIIVEDGGMFYNDLMEVSDVYMRFKKNEGFSVNVNRGWKMATGDYVMIASSDTQLRAGNLKDLCVAGKVTSPEIVNQYIDHLAGPFFCTPKEVVRERGMLMEEMKIYSSDSEYDLRVRDIFVKVPEVQILHEMMMTVKAAGVEGGEQQQKDREAYQKLIDEGKAK